MFQEHVSLRSSITNEADRHFDWLTMRKYSRHDGHDLPAQITEAPAVAERLCSQGYRGDQDPRWARLLRCASELEYLDERFPIFVPNLILLSFQSFV